MKNGENEFCVFHFSGFVSFPIVFHLLGEIEQMKLFELKLEKNTENKSHSSATTVHTVIID